MAFEMKCASVRKLSALQAIPDEEVESNVSRRIQCLGFRVWMPVSLLLHTQQAPEHRQHTRAHHNAQINLS